MRTALHYKKRRITRKNYSFFTTPFFVFLAVGIVAILGFIFIRPQKNELAFHRQLFGPWQYTGEVPGVMKTSLGNDKNQVMVKVQRGDSSLQFNVPLSNTSETNKNQTIIFSEKTKTIDTSYKLTSEGIKEEITLYKIPQENVFKNTITTNNLVAKISSEGVPVFFDTKGVYQFHFSRPFVRDAAGNISYAVSYTIGQIPDPFQNSTGKNTTKQLLSAAQEVSAGQNYVISVTVDSAWLHDPKRKLPIVIDPTVVHDSGSEFASGSMNRVSDNGTESSPQLESDYQELSSDVNTVALWHLNEANGGNALDSSGNGNIGVPTGTTVVGGLLGNARTFDGSSYLSVADNGSLDLTGDFTISGWVMRTSGANGTLVSKTVGTTTGGYAVLWGTAGEVYCRTNNGVTYVDSYTPTGVLASGAGWTHVAAVKSGTKCHIYINGIDRTSTDNSHPDQIANTLPLVIGARTDLITEFTVGEIDEVSISNVARSAEEIQMYASRRPSSTYTSPVIDLAKPVVTWNNFSWTSLGQATGDGETATSSATSNLVAQWNFNETSGTTAVSGGTCGTSCNGALNGFTNTTAQDAIPLSGWTSANRRWGTGALMFDGIDDYVSVPNNSLFNFDYNNNFSIEMWLKTGNQSTTTNTENDILFKYDGAVGRYPFRITYVNQTSSRNGQVTFARWDGTNAPGISSNPINDGKYHYLTFIKNGSTLGLYQDGKLISTTADTTSSTTTNTSALCIGTRCSTPSYSFTGIIDSTRIYSRALTASEIISNYNSSKIELQTRVGTTANPNDGTWEAWKPTTSEHVIDSMDTSANTWTTDNNQNYPSTIAKTGTIIVGTGADGACTVSSGTTNINTGSCSGRGTADAVNFSSTVLTSPGATSITLSSSPAGLTAGDEVLIINLQGTIDDYDSVGQYETHTISSISTNTLNFVDSPIQNTFNGTTQKIMVQRVPNYTNVTISSGATLTASSWNSAKGGVIFFRANGTVTNGGTISMNGSGFVGGSPGGNAIGTDNCLLDGTSANGRAGESFGGATTTTSCTGATRRNNLGGGSGGAGYATWYTPNSVEGGSGGSYGTAGTAGTGDSAIGTPGMLYGNNNNLFLGSGGGSAGGWTGGTAHIGGLGGSGGGIIYISSTTITNNNIISANGNRGLNSNADAGGNGAAGGGGSGGSIILNANTLTVGSGKAVALGGVTSQQTVQCGGSYPRCGGNGGAGRIVLSYGTTLSGVTFPAASTQKVQSQIKQEGTGAVQLPLSQIGVDSNTVGMWHFDETSGSGDYLKNASSMNGATYTYTGADQTFTVPSDVTSITTEMWGGGGGGGNAGGWTYGFPGGGGGYTTGTLAVTPGQALTVMVGAGGTNGSIANTNPNYGGGARSCNTGSDCRYGGQGGGRSSLRYSGADLITAGGGGGGGASRVVNSEQGGSGGGTTGGTGSSYTAGYAGGGGTQSAGGAAGTGASAGTQYAGGNPASNAYGGSGGGGWYGGGGGGYFEPNDMGGGGGGSGYVGGAGVSNAFTVAGKGATQAYATDPANGGAGVGGAASVNGANGRVVITYNSVANANNFTPTGTTLIEGVSTKARHFNGTMGDYLSKSSFGDFPTEDITTEFWVKTTDINDGIISYASSVSDNDWLIYNSANLQIYRGTYGAISTGIAINDNQWHHIAVTWTSSDGTAQLYEDGVLVFTGNIGSGSAITPGGTLVIGQEQDSVGGGFADGQAFSGDVDELRISNIVRTPEAIAESYRMGRDHRISKTISLANLSTSNKIPFSVASDRLGTFSQVTIGKSAFVNYESDANTVGLWHLDEDQSSMPTYFDYDSFEGGSGSPDDWQFRNTVDPDITSTTAYTGSKSLHMSAGWGRNFESGSGEPSTIPYDTATYPYMCMAYKIPSATLNNMLILVDGAWHSVTMTQGETPTSYSKVATWNPLTADNAWHYKCINLNTQLNASLGGTTHSISAVIWHDGGGMGTIAGEFWIDDFFIGAQMYYPAPNYPKDSSGNTPTSQQAPIVATGGTVTHVNGYTIHSFTGTGTFQVTSGKGVVDALVVAGGGGGANTGSGGGGGGVVQSPVPVTVGSYSVTVGNGGSGGLTTGAPGVKGGNSVFSTVTAEGGGNGVSHGGIAGGNGGSGGGGSISTSGSPAAGGTGSQGKAGGAGYVEASWIGNSGGGGGAATVGIAGGNTAGTGNGGSGIQNSMTGTSTYYAGGGGGGEVSGSFVGAGGAGGGGGATVNAAGTSGTANTGGGGGGGSYNAGTYTNGGNGGSGIVIIRYPDQAPTTHATAIGTMEIPGIMGKARLFNGTSDYIDIPDSSALRVGSPNLTFDVWIKPDDLTNCGADLSPVCIILAKEGSYELGITNTGKLHWAIQNTSPGWVWQNTGAIVPSGKWSHIAFTYNGSVALTYMNGALVNSITASGNINNTTYQYSLRIGARGTTTAYSFFPGSIDEVRVSNSVRSADEIRQVYEIGNRSQNITIDFKAQLNPSNLITGSSDYNFAIDEKPFGSSVAANHIFPGEKIIVKENIDGTDYMAQGLVTSVDNIGGGVSVLSWDAGSTFPSGGFTVNATIFKWQREYFDINNSLSTQRSAITRLTYRITDGSVGANIWLDDLRSSTNYLGNGSAIASSVGDRYFQYRAILSQDDEAAPSSALTTLTLNYANSAAPNLPSLDSPTNAATGVSLFPVLKTTAADPDSDAIKYKITLCTDAAMTVNCQLFDQTTPATGWSAASYGSGVQGVYTVQTALAPNTVYYWKSQVIDPSGSSTWSTTQTTAYSFTTNAPAGIPSLDSPTNTATGVPVIVALKTTTTDPQGDALKYKINVCTDLGMSIGCQTFDQTISATGWSAASYASGVQAVYTLQTPLNPNTVYYWRSLAIDQAGSNTWSATQVTPYSFTTNRVAATPSLDSPSTASINIATSGAVLKTTTTDPEGDTLLYKINLCSDSGMTLNCQTFDQTTSTTGWSAASYGSGIQGVYTLQTILNRNTTYYWKSQAIDPSGSNTWSTTQATAYSFTTVNYAMATGCKATLTAPTTIVITWNDNSTQETGYSLERSTNGGTSWNGFQPALAPSTLTYTDSPISLNTNYKYRVAPYFADGSSAPWCYTSAIDSGSGTFKMNGINLNGININ